MSIHFIHIIKESFEGVGFNKFNRVQYFNI